MPCRIGNQHRPFDVDAANRVRPVADDRLDAVLAASRQAIRHRVDVGVDAGADVLKIDDEGVEPLQHGGRRLACLAVERIDRHASQVVARVRRLDHVLLEIRPEAVLRPENRAQYRIAPRGGGICCVDELMVN
jgi:hypothetical protein